MHRALGEPLRRIAVNADDGPSVVVPQVAAGVGNFGHDAATAEHGGIGALRMVDPVRVARLGLRDAAFVATLTLMTDGIVVDEATPSPAEVPAAM